MGKLSVFFKKYNSLSVPVKASFFFVFCGLFKDAVEIITTPIFTRILSTEEFGLFGVYNSWYQVLRIIITLSIYSEIYNVGLAKYGKDTERFTSSQQGLITVLFITWLAVVVLFFKRIIFFTGMDPQLIILMLIQTYFTSFYALWFQKKKYVYCYKILTMVTLIYTVLQPLVGIVAIKLNSCSYNNGLLRIYTGVGIQILFGVIFFAVQFCRNKTFYVKEYWFFSLRNNIPLLPHYLSQVVLNQTDKLMINAFAGMSATAIYNVAHSAAFVPQVITSYLNGTLVPWFYEKLKNKSYEGIRSVITVLVFLVSFIIFALVLLAPEAMHVLAGKEYNDGIWLIPPLAYSVFLIFIYVLFTNFELYHEKSLFVLCSSLLGAILNIILNYYFIKQFGYFAAGYTTLAGYFVMCCSHMFFVKLICKEKGIPFSFIYDLKQICVIALILLTACALVMFFYRLAFVRYLIIVVLITVFFTNKNRLVKFYSELKQKK